MMRTTWNLRTLRAAAVFLAAAMASACAISRQQEVAMGTDYAAQIDQQLPLIRDAEVNRYIALLGDSIARVADQHGYDWTFKIVNAPEVNAFAVPGGFIYINRGLIERSDNLAQVAGVLAHEIGHVVERHSVEQMQKASGANLGVGVLCILTPSACRGLPGVGIQVAGASAFAKFSRDDESEADRVAVDYMVRAGIDPRGIPAMFRKLIEERRSRPSALEGFFSTHPLTEDRIEHTEALIARYDPAILRGLTTDSPRFQEFKRRLRSLPASSTPRRSRD